MFLLSLSTALAAPRFVDAPRAIQTRADQAWPAGITCTGREARHQQTVSVSIGPIPGGFAGRAFINSREGLTAIEFELPEPAHETALHEAAHAWISIGPPGLIEGRINLLAACMAESLAQLTSQSPRSFTLTEAEFGL